MNQRQQLTITGLDSRRDELSRGRRTGIHQAAGAVRDERHVVGVLDERTIPGVALDTGESKSAILPPNVRLPRQFHDEDRDHGGHQHDEVEPAEATDLPEQRNDGGREKNCREPGSARRDRRLVRDRHRAGLPAPQRRRRQQGVSERAARVAQAASLVAARYLVEREPPVGHGGNAKRERQERHRDAPGPVVLCPRKGERRPCEKQVASHREKVEERIEGARRAEQVGDAPRQVPEQGGAARDDHRRVEPASPCVSPKAPRGRKLQQPVGGARVVEQICDGRPRRERQNGLLEVGHQPQERRGRVDCGRHGEPAPRSPHLEGERRAPSRRRQRHRCAPRQHHEREVVGHRMGERGSARHPHGIGKPERRQGDDWQGRRHSHGEGTPLGARPLKLWVS